MTLVSWIGILVMCIFGWLSYIQRKEELEKPKQIIFLTKPTYLVQPDHITLPPKPKTTSQKTRQTYSYDDPKRSISIR